MDSHRGMPPDSPKSSQAAGSPPWRNAATECGGGGGTSNSPRRAEIGADAHTRRFGFFLALCALAGQERSCCFPGVACQRPVTNPQHLQNE